MHGTLYGIGVGPGDPELMTVKAVRLTKECPVIAVPGAKKETCVAYQIAVQAVPQLAEKNVLEIHMPMTKDKAVLEANYKAAAEEIMTVLDSGQDVGMLTLGDPTVYSTYMYVHQIVEKAGYDTKIISGITSFCAAAAQLNHSLVERQEPLHIYPGSYDINELFNVSGTKVLMKSASSFAAVKEQLKEKNMEVNMVENCGMTTQRVFKGIDNLPEASSYYTLIIAKPEKE